MRAAPGGHWITTEILPHKAELARRNLRECGLQDIVEMRVGDALETLADGPSAPEMVVLDGRNDLYVPVLDLLAPRLPAGALVVADLNTDDPDVLAYQRHIREPGSGFFSTELPLDAGIELSVRLESRAVTLSRDVARRTLWTPPSRSRSGSPATGSHRAGEDPTRGSAPASVSAPRREP